MKIAILGPPGSGKGTQIELINKDYKIPVIAVGASLRNVKDKKLNIYVNSLLKKGNFAPNIIANKIVLKKIKQKNFVLDGYPRDLPEAIFLDKKASLDKVFLLKINKKTIINRLKNRRICSCGMTYNLLTKKPKHDLKCDGCKKKLVKRADDYSKAINNRISLYKKKTLPVIRHYKDLKILIEIDADKEITEIYSNIKKHLRNV